MKKFKKLVILQQTGIEEFVLDELNTIANEVVTYSEPPKSKDDILKRCEGADCLLITFSSHLDEYIINNLKDLKHIGLCCSLYDDESSNVDLKACKENYIFVSGVSEYGDDGVIEFIISELSQLTLGLGKHMFFKEPTELKSLKLGIIGLGSLGKKVARTASFFGMDISYYGRHEQTDVPYTYLPLEELISTCDVISLHLPRNIVLLNKKEFDLMSNSKIIIDTGLGYSFNQDEFENWIKNTNHYGIFDTASIDSSFQKKHRHNDRVIINPKVSGFTKNARERLAKIVLNNLKTYLSER